MAAWLVAEVSQTFQFSTARMMKWLLRWCLAVSDQHLLELTSYNAFINFLKQIILGSSNFMTVYLCDALLKTQQYVLLPVLSIIYSLQITVLILLYFVAPAHT